jgi:hypothetical protein
LDGEWTWMGLVARFALLHSRVMAGMKLNKRKMGKWYNHMQGYLSQAKVKPNYAGNFWRVRTDYTSL